MRMTLADQAHAGIRGLHAYVPGKPIADLQRELGLDSILKLASNENSLGTAPAAARALAACAGELHRYPDGSGYDLKAKLAAEHDIDPARVTLGNGSDDILELTARVFLGPGKNAVMSRHAFAVYPIVTAAVNAEARLAPALGDAVAMPYGHDLAAMRARIDAHTGVVFIANPNNPTGTWIDPEALAAFLAAVPAATVVVLDQAYLEYQDAARRPDVRAWLDRFDNLIVTRTFSKIYGMAGLRVGYGLSSPLVADLINRVRQPFNVNTLALVAAAAALDDSGFVDRSIAMNSAGRAELAAELAARGLAPLPSQANFVTFDCGRDAAPLFAALLREGVIVRPLAGYGLPRHLRVTVGAPADNARFIRALDSVRERV